MAKIVISLESTKRGLSVNCNVEPGEKDNEQVQHLAAVVAAGLAGHVNQKIIDAINKKAKKNVH
ncbi:hypothetical protein [Erwinia sp. V71]|uniref:hypothetical protein n=1 Tax=Erwinia sp. V71 TaxID=3369424 RepID=UPI003F5EC431